MLKKLVDFYQISDVIGNTTCEEDFQKIKNARQYYINFTDYLTTSYLNITNNKLYQLCHKPHGFLVELYDLIFNTFIFLFQDFPIL